MSIVTESEDPSTTSYDEVPYPGAAFPGTHPCHMAMVGRFCGIDVPDPRSCRVLELGCAIGSNLLPMAASLPESQFVGVDLSGRQIEEAKAAAKEAGVSNAEFHCLDIADVDDTLGKFDYVICHGVYSWVPSHVQEAILGVAKRQMSERGLLLVSYNTLPGWHLRGAVREMMMYHVADLATPREKIAQSRALLKFLAESAKSSFDAYPMLLKHEAEGLAQRGDHYLFHEHLEEFNEPLYFHQFVDRVHKSGLRYMADTALSMMVAQLFDESVSKLLKNVPLIKREQYMDFLRSRAFRSSLMCHPEVTPNYANPMKYLRTLDVRLTRVLKDQTQQSGETKWRDSRSGQLTTLEPITSMFRDMQQRFPGWVSVDELVNEVAGTPEEEKKLLDAVVSSFIQGLTQLSNNPPRICTTDTEKPECAAYCRYQAEKGTRVTTLQHRDIQLQTQQRFLVQHMDGTRTQEDLAKLLLDAVREGRFRVTRDEDDVKELSLDICRQIVETEVKRLQRVSLVVA